MGEQVTVKGPPALHIMPGTDGPQDQHDHAGPFAGQLSAKEVQCQQSQAADHQHRQSRGYRGESQELNKRDHAVGQ